MLVSFSILSIRLQYDRKGVPDVWDVSGTVTCKAEIESVSPEVTLTLGHADSPSWTPLENLLYHPCVQNYQTQSECPSMFLNHPLKSRKRIYVKYNVIIHPSFEGAFLPGTSKKNKGVDSCRIRIMPPLEPFVLCHYTANLLRELPIDGFYQMKASQR